MKNFNKHNKLLFRLNQIFSFIILSIIMFISINIIIPNKSIGKTTVLSNIKPIYSKSKVFESWESLPDSERNLEFQPRYSNLSIKDSMKRSEYNLLLNENTQLEPSYNLDKTKITVKDQKALGSCWAFALTSILETNFTKKYNKEPILYSPMHIEYKTYDMYTRDFCGGGNYYLTTTYMADGYGPVYEEDLPFESVYKEDEDDEEIVYVTSPKKVNTNIEPKARLKDSVNFPTISKNFSENSITYTDGENKTYTEEEVSAIRNKVKQHIKNYGAVGALFYSDMGAVSMDSDEILSDYYNNETYAYYCNDSEKGGNEVNHALAIVGWDDNFSKDNFGTGENPAKPIHDGAYIILNSWGDETHDKGYFYVSYDDASIETSMSGIIDIEDFTEEPEAKNAYDNIYQYDELGYSMDLVWGNVETEELYSSLYGANLFTKKNSEQNEYVTEVGIFVPITEGIEIYVNENGENLSEGKLVATYTGANAIEPGYHIFKLASPVKITGDKFAIKVKFIQSEAADVPIECNLYENGLSDVSTYWDKVEANPNESFISVDNNEYYDLYNPDFEIYKNSNICIKAFTTLEENLPKIDVAGVSLNKSSLTMEVGDKTNLEATINPDNATDKTITWKSSDPTIASVSNTGIITALKEGTVTITVTTADGDHTAECNVTVIPKKNTDDDIYKDDDEDTPGGDSESSEGTGSGDSETSGETELSDSQGEEEAPAEPSNAQVSNDEKMPTVLPQTGFALSESNNSLMIQNENLVFLIVMIVLVIGSSILTITMFVKYKKKNNIK